MSNNVRVSLALNAGPKAGKAQTTCVVSSHGEALHAEAVKKLRLKKKDAASARLFLWTKDKSRGGTEIPREGSIEALVRNDDLIAVSLGEEYGGPGGGAANANMTNSAGDTRAGVSRWLRWEARPLVGSLAVVEWSDARSMNATLGRLSTLLEHPTLCLAAHGKLVTHSQQRSLPSNQYVGHNLYAETLRAFEALCGEPRAVGKDEATMGTAEEARVAATPSPMTLAVALPCAAPSEADPPAPPRAHVATTATALAPATAVAPAADSAVAPAADSTAASASEASFLQRWRAAGSPSVIINFVTGEVATLRHELCHARYALDDGYRHAVDSCWAGHAPKLGRWMRDLGYHETRHADEFGAYLLTEPPAFWRGRLHDKDVMEMRVQLLHDAAAAAPAARDASSSLANAAAVDVTDDDAHESESSCAAHAPAGAEEEAAARERRERQWVALELGTEVQREPLT